MSTTDLPDCAFLALEVQARGIWVLCVSTGTLNLGAHTCTADINKAISTALHLSESSKCPCLVC